MSTTHRTKALSRRRSIWQLNLTMLPTLIVAALPKCPLCLTGLLSTIGVGSIIQVMWLLPLTLVFLGISLIVLTFRARRRQNYKPLLLGVCAALIFVVGKFETERIGVAYFGLTLLIAAYVWSDWPKPALKETTDCSC